MSSGYHGWFDVDFDDNVVVPQAQHARRFPLRLVSALLVGVALFGAFL